MAGRTSAALMIIDRLGPMLHRDLAGSWMARAAVGGDALAPAVLAQQLVQWSWDHPEEEVPRPGRTGGCQQTWRGASDIARIPS